MSLIAVSISCFLMFLSHCFPIFASAFPVEGHSEEDIDMVRKQQDSAKGPACIDQDAWPVIE